MPRGIQGQIVITIDLSGLKLAGTISPAIDTSSLTPLQSISLAGNRLTRVLPSSLSHLSNLQYLNLFGGKLGGPVPSFLGSLPGVVTLDLSYNNFSGPLPALYAFQPTNCPIVRGKIILILRAGSEDFRARPSKDQTDHATSANPSESPSSDSEVEFEHEMA
ncbi:hypothetical protein Cgig2_031227 [Carnegiea gigantea]|uniref:Uncharacterized protein n=1 Tax=Carnegiea gigantea TaxID=171969 RepID=A0A9Q1KKX0_9CARY|nr:hypothetical protein Cgig2_031227 [Carnegiea gigantea]